MGKIAIFQGGLVFRVNAHTYSNQPNQLIMNTTGTEKTKAFLATLFPPMERMDRKELLQRIQDGAQTNKDYVILIVLSTSLASLGLLQGSTAVVIGAMLVAPLMGPLIGAGMAIVQGNVPLFRLSIKGVIVGITLGFAVSLFIGLINPGFEPSLEIEARGEPDAMDLGIAFLSGFVAAYAMSNKKLAASIAGVAISAALIPPLAVTGVALMLGYPTISLNSGLLLATNIVAIILGSAIAFRILGLHKSIQEGNVPRWRRRAVILLCLCTVFLLVPLSQKLITKKKIGQSRPLTLPVAAKTRDLVKGFLALYPDVELIMMARISGEPNSGVVVLLSAFGEVDRSFHDDLTQIIQQSRGKDVPVKIVLLSAAHIE